MQIHPINSIKSSNLSQTKNISFGQLYNNYSNAVGQKLPSYQEVFLDSDCVLSLGENQRANGETGFLFALDSQELDNAFKRNGNKDSISIGTSGDIRIPYPGNSDVSAYHIDIKKAPDGKRGYIVKDESYQGTTVSAYKDYTNKPDGTMIPSYREVLIDGNAMLDFKGLVISVYKRCAFNSAKMKSKLDCLIEGKQYVLGKNEDIVEEKLVPYTPGFCPQISIRKIQNYFAVRDVSKQGVKLVNYSYKDKWAEGANRKSEQTYSQSPYGRSSGQSTGQQWYHRTPEQSFDDAHSWFDARTQQSHYSSGAQYGQRTQSQQNNGGYSGGGYYSGYNGQTGGSQSQQHAWQAQTPKRERWDCSEKCQSALEEFLKPLSTLKKGEKIPSEMKEQMKKKFRLELVKSFHPDLNHSADPRDFIMIQKKLEQIGLIDSQGHWKK